MRVLLIILVAALANARDGDSIDDSNEDLGPPRLTRNRRAVNLAGFKSNFANLKAKFNSIPENPRVKLVMDKLSSEVANLTAQDVQGNLEKLQKVTASLEKNWASLTGDDAAKIATAVCDLVGTAAAFAPPPAGQIATALMGIVSSIIGMASPSSQPKSMADIVGEVMDKKLNAHYKQVLQGQITGAIRQMDQVQVFLNGYRGGRLSDRDYQFMISQYDMFDHVPLVGQLENHISTLAKSKSTTDASDAVKLIDSYVVLTSMIEVLMQTIQSILTEDGTANESARGVGAVIVTARKQMKNSLNFLRNPKVENGIAVALYNPEEHVNVEAIMDGLEIKDSVSFSGCYKITSKYKNKSIYLYQNAYLISHAWEDNTAKLRFQKNGKYWYMGEGNTMICAGKPNSNGFKEAKYFTKGGCSGGENFRIVAFTDGGYLIVNTKWPTSPLFLEKREEDLEFYDPSPRGHWVVALDNTWSDGNPEYVWLFTKVNC